MAERAKYTKARETRILRVDTALVFSQEANFARAACFVPSNTLERYETSRHLE